MIAQTISNSNAITLGKTFDYTALNPGTDIDLKDYTSANANGPSAKDLKKYAQYDMKKAISAPADFNEKMGPELSEMVVKPFINIYGVSSDENILKEKRAAYPSPANVKTLRVPKLNSWLYEMATEEQKQQEWDLQNVQAYMVASMSAVAAQAQTMDNLKQWAMNSNISDKTHIFAKSYESLMDANHFMTRAMHNTNQFRRKLIGQGLADSFMKLLNENEATPDWLAGVVKSSAMHEVKGKDAVTDELHMIPTENMPNKSLDGQEIRLTPSLQDEDSKDNLGISTIDAELFGSLEPSDMMGNEKEWEDSESDGTEDFSPTLKIQVDRSDRVERPLVCSECGKVYKCADHLKTHIKWHMQDNPAKYSHGDVEFLLGNLETHLRKQTHHCCPVCSRGFSKSKDLILHMKIHTTEAHRCSICGQVFGNKAALLLHSYSKHKLEKADKSTKGFPMIYEVIPITDQTKGNQHMFPQSSNLRLSQANTLATSTEVLINKSTGQDSTDESNVPEKDFNNHYLTKEEQWDSESAGTVEYQPSSPVDQIMTDIDVKLHVGNSMAEEYSKFSSANNQRKNYTGKPISVSNHSASISLCSTIPDGKNTSQKSHACTDLAKNSVCTESSEIKEMMDQAHDDESVVFEKGYKLLTENEHDNSGPDGAKKLVHAAVPRVYKYRAPGERPHLCTECGKRFKQAGHLKDHMQTHTGQKRYVCSDCGQRFSVASQLKCHMSTHTGEHSSGVPTCADCGKTFYSFSTLKNHIKIHTGEKSHVCTYCKRAFRVLSTLRQHIMTHTGSKPFVCKDCGKGFRTSTLLKMHIKSHPAGHCPDCGERFTSEDSLDAHLKTHKDRNLKTDRRNKSHDALCSVCNKTFSTSASLRMHMRTHTEEKHFECKVCGIDCKLSSLLKTHMKTHTMQSKDCIYCGKRFRNLDVLKTHMMKHTDKVDINTVESIEVFAGPLICPICGKEFRHAGHLRAHIGRHPGEKLQEEELSAAAEKIVCQDCGQVCNCMSSLINHMRTHTGEKPFACTYCPKAFSVIGTLRSHLMIHTGEKPFVCKICGEAFRTSCNLKVHLKSHPAENCPVCGERFSSMDNLNVHLKTHRQDKSLGTLCSVCNKVYSTPGNLKIHMLTHTGEKPFLCPDCGKRFNTNNNLKSHIRTHTGEKPQECSYCGNRYNEPSQLIKHVRIHTGERPYVCTECGKGFRASGSLRDHMRVHTGERPYTCPDCGKTFKTHTTLRKHRRGHTGDLPYACPECGKGCYTQWEVNQHMNTHTGEKPFMCSSCGRQFGDKGSMTAHMKKMHT